MTLALLLASRWTLFLSVAAPLKASHTILSGAAVSVIRSPGPVTLTADRTAEDTCSWPAPASWAASAQCKASNWVADAMAAAILESWLSKLVAAVTAATAADTWATETMACAWARSARAFSFLPCWAASLCWKYHLVTELEWRWQLMELLPVASSCRAEMLWGTKRRKEARDGVELWIDWLHVGTGAGGRKRRGWRRARRRRSPSPAWGMTEEGCRRGRRSSAWWPL